MAVSVQGTQITFNDNTNQTTAFAGFGAFNTISVYNNPATLTTPANTTKIYAVVMGGGGGGGGSNPNSNNSGGGGGTSIIGAGFYTVTASTPYAITVGAAGNGGGVGGSGNAGGASSVGNLITANGGGAGNASGGANPGNNGAAGTSPLAQLSMTGSDVTRSIWWSNSYFGLGGGGGGATGDGGGPGSPGNAGNAGRVIVYY